MFVHVGAELGSTKRRAMSTWPQRAATIKDVPLLYIA
jgi:hypothetical protein